MDLPRPKFDNVIPYSNMLGRRSLPPGAGVHKPAKAGRWRVGKPRKDKGVSFSISGPCSGDLVDVVTLGMRIAREAMDRGELEYAERIVKRLRKLPLEYEREKLLKVQKRLLRK